MLINDNFPSKLATGKQFCNRIKEKNFLKTNIEKCRHTVLVAPRRYGKSSLVTQVTQEIKIPFASLDLFLAHDDVAVTKRILGGVSQLVSQMTPTTQKMLVKLQNLFNRFKVSLSAYGFSVGAAIETQSLESADQIFSSPQNLDHLAKEQDKKLIFFIDEFQDISEANSSKSIQGAIRHVAQETSHISFIFSGSNRRLLLELFHDKSKPLYLLCDTLNMERMSSEDYEPHIQPLAKKRWGNHLASLVFDKIIALTELHPYYINLLCNKVWESATLPTFDDIFDAWQLCYENHEDRLIAELEKLTTKQQDVLKAIALTPTTEPTGHDFITTARMPISSVSQTIKSLLDKDMIYKVKKIDKSIPQLLLNQIRVLDPLLGYALKKYA